MYRFAHQTMKYMAVGFVAIFLVSCAWAVKPTVLFFSPTQAEAAKSVSPELNFTNAAESILFFGHLSAGSSSINVLVDQQSTDSCNSDENTLIHESQDSDEALIQMDGTRFFSWAGGIQDGPGIYSLTLGQPILKIPIAWF